MVSTWWTATAAVTPRLSFSSATSALTIARFVRDGLIASRLSTPDRITVVGEWTSGDFFDISDHAAHRTSMRDEYRIDADRPIVSVIGMLRDDKGQDLFIRVIAEMRNRGRRITGLVVGSATQPDYERTLREMVADLDVGDDIVFTGYRDDVARLTQASDVLTIPSYLEAQSRTAPQAFACGTPVVAHRVGGVPELVGHGETGWLVDVGDVAAFADALCRVLDGTEEVNQVTARARRMAEENLQMDTKMAETLAVYEKVIEMRDKTG